MKIPAGDLAWPGSGAPASLFRGVGGALAAAVLAGCSVAQGAAVADPETLAPGTYEVVFCPQDCGSPQATPAVSGIVVLDENTFLASSVSDSARAYYERHTAILYIGDAQRAPTACFAFVRNAPRAPTYAGLEKTGMTRWMQEAESAEFRIVLYHSPDASYVARLTPTVDGFRGRGTSYGGGVPRGSIPDDLIQGRRVGPPDPSICGRAAEAAAADLRARSRRSGS